MVKDNSDNKDFYQSLTSKKLDLKTKLAYGAGDLGPAITANIAVFYMMVFFTNVAGISAGLAGSILMIGKIGMVSMILWWEC